MHLKKKCILQFGDGMSSRYQLGLSGPMCHLRLVSLLIFFLDDVSIGVSEVFKSPTITALFFPLL